jgi:hypothetical protein
MRRSACALALLLVTVLVAAGCEKKEESGKSEPPGTASKNATGKSTDLLAEPAPPAKKGPEPEHITVQHILISFRGRGTKATRSMEEAKKLAEEIFARAKKEDFNELVKNYTDDSPPGIYKMANRGVQAAGPPVEYNREGKNGMVPAFGDVGFSLEVGEIGMAPYDERKSPFGWHIIKRIN